MTEQVANVQDFKALDRQFVNNLRHHLYSKSPQIYSLHRALGKNCSSDLMSYIDFLSIAGENTVKSKEDIYFIVASVFYNVESIHGGAGYDDESNVEYVSFEKLLGRLYKTSDSTAMSIKGLLRQTNVNSSSFRKQFALFVGRCKKEIRTGESLDYVKLLNDLKFWNTETRYRWAEVILSDS